MQKRPMGNKSSGTRSATVSKAEVTEALSRGTPRLAAEEEKALRMLHGVSAPRTTVLERVGQDHPDSREKLLGIELELLRQWRERQAARPDPRSQAKVAAPAAKASNPKRARIVAALKSKKSTR